MPKKVAQCAPKLPRKSPFSTRQFFGILGALPHRIAIGQNMTSSGEIAVMIARDKSAPRMPILAYFDIHDQSR
jgi:hypothetical protein